MGLRQDLQVHLEATMVDTGVVVASEVTVYGAGVDIVAVPAVVINPGDPYESVVTMKQSAIQTNLELYLIAPRADPAAAFTFLEDLRLCVTNALQTSQPAYRWVNHGGFGGTEVGGVAYATSMLEIITVSRERVASP